MRLKSLAAGCASVGFLPFFPASKIPAVLAAGDVQVITVKKGLEGVVVPSKLYGILAAGKPILAVAEKSCDIRAIADGRNCGRSASPESVAETVQAMEALSAGGASADFLKQMGEAARRVAPEFERQGELQKFVQFVEAASRS